MGRIVDDVDIINGQDKDAMLLRALKKFVELYPDKTHFVFELLQNAEDVKATHVSFRQFSDRLEFLHNGCPFTKSNLQSLCDIGLTDKGELKNAIGKFGIGFKSVFTICNFVKLYSKSLERPEDYIANIIENYVTPTNIEFDWNNDNFYTTKFVFPYNSKEFYNSSDEELKKEVAKKLKELGTNVLLFMKNIKEIHYSISISNKIYDCKGSYTLQKENIADNVHNVDNVYKIITSDGSDNTENTYMVFSKKIPEIERTVDIAFSTLSFDNNREPKFIKTNLDKISVYFPTMTDSKVNFIVQAPFDLDPNRSNLLKGSKHNVNLLRKLAELLKSAIFIIKDKKWLSLELINLLPYKAMGNEDDWSLYNMYKETIKLLKTESIIPCIDKSYINANKAKIVRGAKLLELFKDNLLCDFINQSGAKWLSEEFTENNKSLEELHRFFKNELNVQEIGSNDLPRLIKNNPSFFYKVSNSWLEDFYLYLYENVPGLLGKNGGLAEIPFIKTNDGNFNAPFKNTGKGKLEQNIYLRPKTANINIKDFLFIDNFIIENCIDFVEALGLEEPDNYDYFIKELVNTNEMKHIDDNVNISQIKQAIKYLKDDHYENAVEKFRCLLKLKLIDTFEKEQYSVILKNNIFLTIYREKDKNNLSIKDYFSEIYCDVLFLDEIFYEKNGVSSHDLSILELLGIKNNIYIGINEKEWKDGVSKCSNKENFRKRLNFENIDNILNYIKDKYNKKSKEKSKIILKLLMNVEKHLYGQWQSKATNPYEDDVSNIIKILRSEKWLYSSKEKQVRPCEISRYDLDIETYEQLDEKTYIYKLLGFKETPIGVRNILNDFDSRYKEKETLELIYNHISKNLHLTSTPSPIELIEVYNWWIGLRYDEKLTLIESYENSIYPRWFESKNLKSSDTVAYDEAWFTLFAIAICQQLGRYSNYKHKNTHKNYLEYLKENSWFDIMVKPINTTSESEWIKIIKEYYESKKTDQQWQEWIKLIPQFFIVRYNMDNYVNLLGNLDKKEKEFELTTILKFDTDPDLNGFGTHLPALNRTLRIGLPFIIRELLRFGIMKRKENIICHAFMPKKTTAKIVFGDKYGDKYIDNNQYTSRDIFEGIKEELGKEYTFGKYYDIPILIYNKGKI